MRSAPWRLSQDADDWFEPGPGAAAFPSSLPASALRSFEIQLRQEAISAVGPFIGIPDAPDRAASAWITSRAGPSKSSLEHFGISLVAPPAGGAPAKLAIATAGVAYVGLGSESFEASFRPQPCADRPLPPLSSPRPHHKPAIPEIYWLPTPIGLLQRKPRKR